MKQCKDCKWHNSDTGLCSHLNYGNDVLNGWVCEEGNRKYYHRKWYKFGRPK